MIKNFLNPEGHKNPFSGSKVTAILLKGWIWPIGGASVGEGLPCSLPAGFFYFSFELSTKSSWNPRRDTSTPSDMPYIM